MPIPAFRFYFDGLIAHVHRQASDNEYLVKLDTLASHMVGGSDKLAVLTVPYDFSLQQNALSLVMADVQKICRSRESRENDNAFRQTITLL